MERYARLEHTSNPNMKQYVGCYGYLSCDEYGRYCFRMEDGQGTIQTSAVNVNTVLGDINHPICRNIGFETRSGSAYQFDFMDVERLHDGVRRVDNRFVGFEQHYHQGDSVYTAEGYKGVVQAYIPQDGRYMVAYEAPHGEVWAAYKADQLQPAGLNEVLYGAQQKAEELNSSSRDERSLSENSLSL